MYPTSAPEPVPSPSAQAGLPAEGSAVVPVHGIVLGEIKKIRAKTIVIRQAVDRNVLGGRDEEALTADAAEFCIPLPVAAADGRCAGIASPGCTVACWVHERYPR